MDVVKGVSLRNSSFSIDDKQMVDCRLVDCTVEYGGGPVILERTALVGCRFVFCGSAKMTLEFLDCVGLLPLTASEWKAEVCLLQ